MLKQNIFTEKISNKINITVYCVFEQNIFFGKNIFGIANITNNLFIFFFKAKRFKVSEHIFMLSPSNNWWAMSIIIVNILELAKSLLCLTILHEELPLLYWFTWTNVLILLVIETAFQPLYHLVFKFLSCLVTFWVFQIEPFIQSTRTDYCHSTVHARRYLD